MTAGCFVALGRAHSFTKAAAKLGVSQSAPRQTIRQRKTRPGVRRLARTARRIALTAAGGGRFHGASRHGLGHGAARTCVVAATPQRGQARADLLKFVTHYPAGPALEAVDDIGHAKRRIGVDEQLDVIRHHVHGVDCQAAVGGDVRAEFLTAGTERGRQEGTSEWRAPIEMIREATDCPGRGLIVWFRAHTGRQMSVGKPTHERRACARPAIAPPPESNGFSRRYQ